MLNRLATSDSGLGGAWWPRTRLTVVALFLGFGIAFTLSNWSSNLFDPWYSHARLTIHISNQTLSQGTSDLDWVDITPMNDGKPLQVYARGILILMFLEVEVVEGFDPTHSRANVIVRGPTTELERLRKAEQDGASLVVTMVRGRADSRAHYF